MPFYIRGGIGPLRYSHRIGGRRRSRPPNVPVIIGVALLGLAFMIAVLVAAFQAGVGQGLGLLAVFAALFLWPRRR